MPSGLCGEQTNALPEFQRVCLSASVSDRKITAKKPSQIPRQGCVSHAYFDQTDTKTLAYQNQILKKQSKCTALKRMYTESHGFNKPKHSRHRHEQHYLQQINSSSSSSSASSSSSSSSSPSSSPSSSSSSSPSSSSSSSS